MSQLENKKEQILNGEIINENLEEIQKKIKHLKIMRLLIKGKKAQEAIKNSSDENITESAKDKNNLDLNENEKYEEKANEGEILDNFFPNIKINFNIIVNLIISDKEIGDIDNNRENDLESKKPKNARQNHCYLYIFKKKF